MSLFGMVNKALLRMSCWRQAHQAMPSPSLWGLGVTPDHELEVAGLSCVSLAKEYGTPLLVVHADLLRQRIAEVQEVMASLFDESMITYSYKTNGIPGILRILHDAGIGAEVISGYEYWLAESLGVDGHRVVYNGVDKSGQSLGRAIVRQSLINIDSPEDLEAILAEAHALGQCARVGIRLALSGGSQFGVAPQGPEFERVVGRILGAATSVELCALHFNVTSNARNSGYHVHCLKRALDVMLSLYRKHGVLIRYLDIGGGYGVDTSKNMTGVEYGFYRLFGVQPGRAYLAPCQTFSAYMADVSRVLKEFCAANSLPVPTVIIEPGRALTSKSEILLATVKAVKEREGGMPFAITDAGRLSQAFPCDFEFHEALLASDMVRPLSRSYNVTGRVCTRSDWLYRGKLLPELRPFDVLAVMDAGAYFSSYAMNFAFPRAEIIEVQEGRVRVLRHRETFRHLVAMDDVPFCDVPE